MKPQYDNGNVRAACPDCGGAVTTFECKYGPSGYGSISREGAHQYMGANFRRVVYLLLRCAGCGRGGLAKVHYDSAVEQGVLESFYPVSIMKAALPSGVPQDILTEFREAEGCASFGYNRAASALFRSTLEKALKTNGYSVGTLEKKIEDAGDDGIISGPRRTRVHEDIRVLGNDVLHDDWREVSDAEVDAAHHYLQRILEDFYDERKTVEKILVEKGRKHEIRP
jgi:hypothetical protein